MVPKSVLSFLYGAGSPLGLVLSSFIPNSGRGINRGVGASCGSQGSGTVLRTVMGCLVDISLFSAPGRGKYNPSMYASVELPTNLGNTTTSQVNVAVVSALTLVG